MREASRAMRARRSRIGARVSAVTAVWLLLALGWAPGALAQGQGIVRAVEAREGMDRPGTMSAMWRPALALVLLLLFLGGCATSASTPARGEERPQVRCLGDSDRRGTSAVARPLLFFFCVESP